MQPVLFSFARCIIKCAFALPKKQLVFFWRIHALHSIYINCFISSCLTRILTPSWLYLIDISNEGRSEYTPPPSPTHLLFCWKLRKFLVRSYWSTAEPCENWQPTSIGRHAERTGNPLLFVDRQIIEGLQGISYPVSRAYTMQNSEVWFLSLDDEPIRGSHFSSFVHILHLKQYNGWISMKSMKTQIILD